MSVQPSLDRLKSQLLVSGLQTRDNPLFQVINGIIDSVKQSIDTTSNTIGAINLAWSAITGIPAIIETLGELANAAGWLNNDGAGVLAWTTPTPAEIGAEPALGNPAADGYVLSSTMAGARSWVAQSGGLSDAQISARIHLQV